MECFDKKPMFFVGNEVEKTKFHGLKTLFVRSDFILEDVLSKIESENVDHVYLGSSKTHKMLWNRTELYLDVEDLLKTGVCVTVESDAETCKDMISWLGASIVCNPKFCLNVSVSVPVWAIPAMAIKLEPLNPFKDGEGVYTFVADGSRLTNWVEYREDKEIE